MYEAGLSAHGSPMYGGWFLLIGELLTAGERNTPIDESGQFEFWFTSIGTAPPAWRPGPRLTLEFTTALRPLVELSQRDGV